MAQFTLVRQAGIHAGVVAVHQPPLIAVAHRDEAVRRGLRPDVAALVVRAHQLVDERGFARAVLPHHEDVRLGRQLLVRHGRGEEAAEVGVLLQRLKRRIRLLEP
eukprot:scaffold8413_cov248-Pinguiococcus_pyrenoidosus.AAC.1